MVSCSQGTPRHGVHRLPPGRHTARLPYRIQLQKRPHPIHSRQSQLCKDHPDIIRKYLATECAKGRMLEPFPIGSMPDIQITRIGVIPKKSSSSKWRLITDVSFSPGKSVNDGINPELTTLSYINVDQIAHKITQLGRGSQLSKMDIEEAYRIVPIHPDDRHLLGCQSDNQVYIDISLPFGLRSAPIIFTALADALQWVIEQRGTSHVAHYLDDFVTVGTPNTDQCYIN